MRMHPLLCPAAASVYMAATALMVAVPVGAQNAPQSPPVAAPGVLTVQADKAGADADDLVHLRREPRTQFLDEIRGDRLEIELTRAGS